jgi:EAL domain-containing protein (putative c-di-GMP-specific phosphodiesterase class I)
MMMIQGIHNDDDKRKLVANMVSFCHPKGIKVVAERVEQVEDLYALIELGIDFVQGYYTGKPDFEFRETTTEAYDKILEFNRRKRDR